MEGMWIEGGWVRGSGLMQWVRCVERVIDIVYIELLWITITVDHNYCDLNWCGSQLPAR